MSQCIPADLPYGIEEAAHDWVLFTTYFSEAIDRSLGGEIPSLPIRLVDGVYKLCDFGREGKNENIGGLGRDWKKKIAARDLFRYAFGESPEKEIDGKDLDSMISGICYLATYIENNDVEYVRANKKDYQCLRKILQRINDFANGTAEGVRYRRIAALDDD